MTVLHLLLTSSGKGGRMLNYFNVEEWIKAILIGNNYLLIINTWAFQVLFFTEIVFVIKNLLLDLLPNNLVLSLISCYPSKTKTTTQNNKDLRQVKQTFPKSKQFFLTEKKKSKIIGYQSTYLLIDDNIGLPFQMVRYLF